MTVDLNRLLKPDDLETLYGGKPTSWVPKNPSDLLLPYISEKQEEDGSSIESRRNKAIKVIEGYETLATNCKKLEEQIEQRCKDATVSLNPAKHLNVIEAIGRLFGIETTEITFEMYKQCINKLAEMNNNNIPTLGN
jgi:hypothetical protein